MIRLIIALAAIMAVVMYLNYGSGDPARPVAPPEVRYEQGRQQVETLEQQLQHQAREQLEALDAYSH